MQKHIEPIADFLRNAGAEQIHLEHGGKHPRLVYTWQGRERFYVVPVSPGDTYRGTKNAISDLRHALGLTGTEKRVGARRTHKQTTRFGETRPEPQPVEFAPDWRERLTSHPALLALDNPATPTGAVHAAPASPEREDQMAHAQLALARGGAPSATGPKPVTRQHAKVPLAEITPLLDRLAKATDTDYAAVLHTIGYSYGTVNDWAKDGSGLAPLRAKYALLGLLSTLEVPAPAVEMAPPPPERVEVPVSPFTFDEMTALFSQLAIGTPISDGYRKALIGKLAQEIARSGAA